MSLTMSATLSGYVLDSLLSARMVLQTGSYEQVVKAAVALGHDTDTTACRVLPLSSGWQSVRGTLPPERVL
jgi:ADP-ribosylglycohydrolase